MKHKDSSTSTLFTFRLDNNVAEILVKRYKGYPSGIAGWLRDRVTYDLTRKHGGGKKRKAD